MQKSLEILYVESRPYTSKKSGKSGVLSLAQCVIREEGGRTIVGELLLPEDLKNTLPGVYAAEFALDVDFEKRVVSKVVKLTPFVKADAVPPRRVA